MIALEREVVTNSKSISKSLIDDVLEPYFPWCRYLKDGEVNHRARDESLPLDESEYSLVGARANFSIPYSCYVKSTGHFNASELIMSFNQLIYCMIAKSAEMRIIPIMKLNSVDDFKRIQLGSSYIAKVDKIRFSRPINPSNYQGEAVVDKMMKRGSTIFLNIDGSFSDDNGGYAETSMLFALCNSDN